jgi:hypothetical protein
MSKKRIPIPDDVASDVIWSSDSTCCVCADRSKAFQIHHIDEDPSNNDPSNLAVLCLQCHDDTQITGGFGRKLNAPLVIKYRDEWTRRVAERRRQADEIAASAGFSPPQEPEGDHFNPFDDESKLVNYLWTLPSVRRSAYVRAKPMWDSGVTPEMKRGCYLALDVMEHVLMTLITWFPERHFGEQTPKEFVNRFLSAIFAWHHGRLEPRGYGTGGTIVGVLLPDFVLQELEKRIVEIVETVSEELEFEEFNLDQWRNEWDSVRNEYTESEQEH